MIRWTLRMQLTLLYAVPFFFCGVALLAIPLLGTNQTEPVGSQGGIPSGPQGSDSSSPVLVASAIALAVMVVVSFVLGWLIAGRFLRPLRAITSTARDISASNLHRRLGRRGRKAEFSELADTLDDLFERLEASFESQRRFVANASHELRTPLTAERAMIQVALADPNVSVETLRSACEEVLTLGQQQERLIGSLLTLASSEQGIEQREPLDLADIAGDTVLSRRGEAQRRGIRVDMALATAPVSGDPKLLDSLVANLVDNGLRHNAAGGWIAIASTTSAGRSSITVQNTGPVIPPDEVERLFQPFQQLGSQRIRHADGYGLGLAIVRAIADAHYATLTPRARPEGGLDIEVTFGGSG
jgi:signal transduction histidine kinase